MDEQNIDRAKRRRGKGRRKTGRRKVPHGCKLIRRRMGKSGVRTIQLCPGQPAKIVG